MLSAVKAAKLPGTQTWDAKGKENPVANLYNVQSYPTWYLIDAKGVIRSHDPFGKALMPAIESALN